MSNIKPLLTLSNTPYSGQDTKNNFILFIYHFSIRSLIKNCPKQLTEMNETGGKVGKWYRLLLLTASIIKTSPRRTPLMKTYSSTSRAAADAALPVHPARPAAL